MDGPSVAVGSAQQLFPEEEVQMSTKFSAPQRAKTPRTKRTFMLCGFFYNSGRTLGALIPIYRDLSR